jgi:A/G-specific adenine glycosylase
VDFPQIRQFNHELLNWFHRNGRDLPWRKTKNPYYIWISEVMLQQTQVDTVIPYYHRFIDSFPTIRALADAPEDQVLKSWEGLGYYSRARNLQSGVREVAEKYHGELPDDKKQLLSIRGIGPYTAGALLSIAFGEPEPAVDGNVMRVMSRIFLIDDDIAKSATKKKFGQIVQELITEADPSAFSQSLMDLGAMICRPRNPLCPECPVREFCRANAEGVQSEYPVKSRKAGPVTKSYAILLLRDGGGKFLIEKRPEKGLLAGLWQFPMVPGTKRDDLFAAAREKTGQPVRLKKETFTLTHHFSHLIWKLVLYAGKCDGPVRRDETVRWLAVNDLERLPFPVPHQKVISWIKDH